MSDLRQVYMDILGGNFESALDPQNVYLMNHIATCALQDENNVRLDDVELVLRISNALYNGTDIEVLPLEDGVYDLLLEMYKRYNPNFQVGGANIGMNSVHKDKDGIAEYPNMFIPVPIGIENTYGMDILAYGNTSKFATPLSWNNGQVSDRQRDTAHKYPELVGTLDKCKFVLDHQAYTAGVAEDPNVKIFERDFIGLHFHNGVNNPNDILNIVMELKYDGISIEAEVSNHVVSARTRGDLDNDRATDLTSVLYGYRFPNTIPDNEVFGMKFEAIITKYDMERLKAKTGKSYTNMRTAVSGILGLANAREYLEYITLVPLGTSLHFDTREEELMFMNRYFATKVSNAYKAFSGRYDHVLYMVDKFVQDADMMRPYMTFAYDGIVVSYNDNYHKQLLGRVNHVNKYSMAIKFNAMKRVTRFRGYSYTVGSNGVITPMIIFDPVEFNGTVHYKASGHSYERYKKLSLRYNDEIEVAYVNDVMPYVSKLYNTNNDKNEKLYPIEPFIDHCPACGSQLVESFSGKTISCENPTCPGIHQAKMVNMMVRLDFKNFGQAAIEKLEIKSLRDLFENVDETRLFNAGFRERGIAKFLDQLNEIKSRDNLDFVIVGSLGFTDIGFSTWSNIFNVIPLDCLIKLSDDELSDRLLAIPGIGQRTVDTILKERVIFADDLVYIYTKIPNLKHSINAKPAKRICFTGIRDANVEAALMANGDMPSESITKSTDYLVVPYKDYSSSKTAKADKYGIPIVTIDELVAQLGLTVKV